MPWPMRPMPTTPTLAISPTGGAELKQRRERDRRAMVSCGDGVGTLEYSRKNSCCSLNCTVSST